MLWKWEKCRLFKTLCMLSLYSTCCVGRSVGNTCAHTKTCRIFASRIRSPIPYMCKKFSVGCDASMIFAQWSLGFQVHAIYCKANYVVCVLLSSLRFTAIDMCACTSKWCAHVLMAKKKIKIKTKSDRKTRTKTNVQRELYVRQRSEEKAVLNSNSGSSSSPAIGGQAKQTT